MSKANEMTIDPELIGVKLQSGQTTYLRPAAVLGLIPAGDNMQLLLVGGTTVTLKGSGGTLRRKLLGLPEPEPKS